MRKFAIFALAAWTVSIFTAGCANLSQEYPGKNQYVISVKREGPKPPDRKARRVSFINFRISSKFEDRSLVYRLSDVKYETDFYNEFLALPSYLVTEETRKWLEGSGLFAGVVATGSRAETQYALEGNITALYGDFSDKSRPRAVMAIQFFLLDTSHANVRHVFHKNYKAVSPIPSNNAAELIKGMNACLTAILREFEADLIAKLK